MISSCVSLGNDIFLGLWGSDGEGTASMFLRTAGPRSSRVSASFWKDGNPRLYVPRGMSRIAGIRFDLNRTKHVRRGQQLTCNFHPGARLSLNRVNGSNGAWGIRVPWFPSPQRFILCGTVNGSDLCPLNKVLLFLLVLHPDKSRAVSVTRPLTDCVSKPAL